jgi:hypothetical protein
MNNTDSQTCIPHLYLGYTAVRNPIEKPQVQLLHLLHVKSRIAHLH